MLSGGKTPSVPRSPQPANSKRAESRNIVGLNMFASLCMASRLSKIEQSKNFQYLFAGRQALTAVQARTELLDETLVCSRARQARRANHYSAVKPVIVRYTIA